VYATPIWIASAAPKPSGQDPARLVDRADREGADLEQAGAEGGKRSDGGRRDLRVNRGPDPRHAGDARDAGGRLRGRRGVTESGH